MTEKPEGKQSILAMRTLQIFSFCIVIVGFIWSTGDYITAMFPENSIINPASVLMMLYGSMGALGSEAIIRFLTKKK